MINCYYIYTDNIIIKISQKNKNVIYFKINNVFKLVIYNMTAISDSTYYIIYDLTIILYISYHT